MNFKCLILGSGQSTFLNPLYRELKKKNRSWDFSIDRYRHYSKGDDKLPYTDYYNFREEKIPYLKYFITLVNFIFTGFFWKILFFEISQKTSYSDLKNKIKGFTEAKYRVDRYIKPKEFDAYHFHFCIPENIKEIYFLPAKARIYCSFWGSDLLRNTGVSNVFYVEHALKKVNKVSIQTPELAQMFLCKYGRRYQDTLHVHRFILDKKIYDEIENVTEQDIHNFKERYRIASDKTLVAIGHNAFAENNHIKIVESLIKLPKEAKDRFAFLFHLSYGGDETYKEELYSLISNAKDLDTVIIKEHFDPRGVAILRSSIDIYIHMPITDALSSAMTEALHAGKTLITGTWLPYSILSRNGIKFFDVDKIEQLLIVLQSLDQKMSCPDKVLRNRKAIRNLLLDKQIVYSWKEFYEF